ncbi:MAG: ABC transporter permease, partial [Azospirillum sp.]|nr:ABC transporter permease [Azospirillum sp.]
MDRALPLRSLVLLTLAGLALFFGIWTLAGALELAPRRFLPMPWDVVERALLLTERPFSGQTLQGHLIVSVERYMRGFILAVVVGVPLGLLMGWYRWLDYMVQPVFDSLRFVAP